MNWQISVNYTLEINLQNQNIPSPFFLYKVFLNQRSFILPNPASILWPNSFSTWSLYSSNQYFKESFKAVLYQSMLIRSTTGSGKHLWIDFFLSNVPLNQTLQGKWKTERIKRKGWIKRKEDKEKRDTSSLEKKICIHMYLDKGSKVHIALDMSFTEENVFAQRLLFCT